MRISSLNQSGQMAEDLHSLPLDLRVKDWSEIDKISDVSVVFHEVPPVKLVRAISFFYCF